jgi:hypothetical protein
MVCESVVIGHSGSSNLCIRTIDMCLRSSEWPS